MKRNFRSGSLLRSLLLIIIFASISRAQMSQSDSVVPCKSITPQMESTMERTKISILRIISQARSDIHRKEWSRARSDLSEAAGMMESIREDLPTSTVKNFIGIARKHLEYEQAKQVLHELPLIYASLERLSVYLPTEKAKMHIDKAKDYLGINKKKDADRELALADKSLIVIEVELPLLKAQRYVGKAREFIAAKNAGKADEALQMAEQRAMTLYSAVNSPLFLAKQNVWLAFHNYSTASNATTGSHLKQAIDNLEKAAAGGSATVKEEAGKLSQEIAELEKKLTGEEKVAMSALKAVWKKSEALVERSVAYLSAGLADAETTLGVENNLIEAKLHVIYAETYQLTTAEPDKAAKELDTAYYYQQKAGTADRKKMRSIGSTLLVLKANPEKSDAVVQERYDKVKEELSELIQKM